MKVKLDKVCKRIYAGGDVPKDRYSTVMTSEYTVPIYANAEKDDGLYGYTDTARENELSITVAARGTIGFTAIRREPFLPVVRLITVVPDLSKVSERYLYYALKNCKPASSGTSIPQLTVPDIKKNEIELYSLPVQEKIANKLDVVVRIIALRQQELQRLDDLVKSRFIELFGDPKQNPKGYPVKEFDEISVLITDGEHATPRRTDKGIYLLSARNILNHALQLDDVDYIDEEEYTRIARRVVPQAGDVLISCSGSIGRCCVVPEELRFQMVRSAALIRFDDTIKPVFAEWLITSDELQRQISMSATQSSQANLFQGKIRKLRGYVPPMELQEQFAAFVEQTDKSKAVIQKALDEAQLLFDSLMQKYYG